MMKKLLLLLLAIVVLYAAMNHKFLMAMTYLHDNDASNDKEAVSLLQDAINNDQDRKSAFLLGYYYKTPKYHNINMELSHQNYLKAAKWGDQEAKMIVAWNFYKGKGCSKDIAQAKEMLTQLAIAGNNKAKEILKFVIRN
jgi:TPR repeat protein